VLPIPRTSVCDAELKMHSPCVTVQLFAFNANSELTTIN
jgi:hypothetical protein